MKLYICMHSVLHQFNKLKMPQVVQCLLLISALIQCYSISSISQNENHLLRGNEENLQTSSISLELLQEGHH